MSHTGLNEFFVWLFWCPGPDLASEYFAKVIWVYQVTCYCYFLESECECFRIVVSKERLKVCSLAHLAQMSYLEQGQGGLCLLLTEGCSGTVSTVVSPAQVAVQITLLKVRAH